MELMTAMTGLFLFIFFWGCGGVLGVSFPFFSEYYIQSKLFLFRILAQLQLSFTCCFGFISILKQKQNPKQANEKTNCISLFKYGARWRRVDRKRLSCPLDAELSPLINAAGVPLGERVSHTTNTAAQATFSAKTLKYI